MLLSLARDPGPGAYTGLWLLLITMVVLPLVGGGFLLTWAIRSLAAGLLTKGLLILALTLLGEGLYYHWLLGLL